MWKNITQDKRIGYLLVDNQMILGLYKTHA